MPKTWTDDAWYEYVGWQSEDKKTLRRINELLKDIERNGPANGIGKPERLKHIDAWSRRIDQTNRLIYSVDENGIVTIVACKGHYND
jgi:toxin YoeB